MHQVCISPAYREKVAPSSAARYSSPGRIDLQSDTQILYVEHLQSASKPGITASASSPWTQPQYRRAGVWPVWAALAIQVRQEVDALAARRLAGGQGGQLLPAGVKRTADLHGWSAALSPLCQSQHTASLPEKWKAHGLVAQPSVNDISPRQPRRRSSGCTAAAATFLWRHRKALAGL